MMCGRVAAAQYALGQLYRDGAGVPQDYVASLHWMALAAEQGLPDVEFTMARFFSGAVIRG